MKKFAFTFIAFMAMYALNAQNVFTYGSKAVSKDEFVSAFNKNPNITPDRKKALEEYLNLYINFKLKVQAAYDEGLDKDATQQYELQNFRRQIADNVINDKANLKGVVKEAFEHSRKEIHLVQVFVEVTSDADTTEARKKINTAWKELKGGKDFGVVAAEYSADEAGKQTKGDLGYISAFSLPYRFENIIYGLKPGAFSAPVKSKAGYHIFKNLDERPSLGTRQVAQILVAFPPKAAEEDKAKAAQKADSLYQLLVKGANFEDLVPQSNDLSSSNNKGELPEFSTGTYSPDFEAVAFSLKKPGDISRPFATSFGYHILKLLEAKPAPDNLNDVTTFGTLQDKVIKDNRLDSARKEVIQKQMPIIHYEAGTYKTQDLYAFTDSVIIKSRKTPLKGISENTTAFSFTKQKVKVADWISFVRASMATKAIKNNYPALYAEFVRLKAEEYYRTNLEDYDTGFAKQIQEFKEANLLFGIMEKNVWSKANADSANLLQYYNQHKFKYMWPASADAVIITSSNQAMAGEIEQKIKDNPKDWKQVTVSYGSQVVADSSRYELSQLPVVDRTNFTPGLLTAPVKNENDGTYTFNYVINMHNEPSPRSFEDSRGIVISDYQQVLEEKWIAELRKKYNVKVNEAVFKTIK